MRALAIGAGLLLAGCGSGAAKGSSSSSTVASAAATASGSSAVTSSSGAGSTESSSSSTGTTASSSVGTSSVTSSASSTSSSGATSSSSGAASTSSTGGAHANGTLGTWAELAPLPSPRANHCSTATPQFLIIMGGNHAVDGGFASDDDVEVAPLLGDGGLGAWILAGQTPSPVSECTIVTDGATLYLIDGIFDDPSYSGDVLTATLSADGGLSAFTVSGAVPAGQDVIAGEAYVAQGQLVTEESEIFVDDGGGALALLSAPETSLEASDWTSTRFTPEFIGRPQWAFDGSHLFALGGYDSTVTALSSVVGVAWSPSAVGAAYSTTALPAPTCFGRAVALDGWVFVVGGKSQVYTGSGATAVYAAPIEDGGLLGAWTTPAPMPLGRTDHAMAVGGDFLYVTGGAVSGPGDSVVLAARIRF